jgi:hypothetical protein
VANLPFLGGLTLWTTHKYEAWPCSSRRTRQPTDISCSSLISKVHRQQFTKTASQCVFIGNVENSTSQARANRLRPRGVGGRAGVACIGCGERKKMSEPIVNTDKSTIDPTWKGVYRAGGLAMVMAGLLFLVGTTFGYQLGVPPGNSNAYLLSLAAHPALARVTYWIFGLTDILLIPAVLGLYLAVKGINKNAMLVAAGLVSFFIVLDLGITELNSLTLVTLTQDYAVATSDVQRAAYMAAEHWGLATLPIATFFSYVGPASGFLIISIVMLKGIFGRNTARLGMIANGLGIVGGIYFLYPVPLLAFFLTPILIVYGAWLIAVGRGLSRLGKRLGGV